MRMISAPFGRMATAPPILWKRKVCNWRKLDLQTVHHFRIFLCHFIRRSPLLVAVQYAWERFPLRSI